MWAELTKHKTAWESSSKSKSWMQDWVTKYRQNYMHCIKNLFAIQLHKLRHCKPWKDRLQSIKRHCFEFKSTSSNNGYKLEFAMVPNLRHQLGIIPLDHLSPYFYFKWPLDHQRLGDHQILFDYSKQYFQYNIFLQKVILFQKWSEMAKNWSNHFFRGSRFNLADHSRTNCCFLLFNLRCLV